MAVAQTMSNPNDWIQSYQTNFSNITQSQTPPETATATSAAATSRNNTNLISDQGRVSKPIRRRSRASRRTPTTLLNTDPANFRAMVQHFTGDPSIQQFSTGPPLLTGGLGGADNFGFTQHIARTDPMSGFQVQYPNQAMQEHMFTVNNMRGGGGGAHAPPGPGNENQDFDNYML